jgi:hypothetical protein
MIPGVVSDAVLATLRQGVSTADLFILALEAEIWATLSQSGPFVPFA